MKIGFIGGGNMAEALIRGISKRAMGIIVSEPVEQKRAHLQKTYGVKTTPSNTELVREAGIIILAVKPQQMEDVLAGIKGALDESKIIVSIAAGIKLSYLQERLKSRRLVRVMPNTPALIGEGVSVISLCECIQDADFAQVKDIFMSVGSVVVMPEKYMDAVTALSGSGPAFIALFIEGLIEGAVKAGLPAHEARELALQCALGTIRMLESGISTEKLRQMVASPGGTTEAGLKVLEANNLKSILCDTIEAAFKRARELGKD